VAGLTAEQRSVGAALCHPLLEFTVMRIGMARGAAHVHEVKGHDLIRAPRCPCFMAVIARDSGVGPGKREFRVAMFGNGEGGAMEIDDGVAILAAVKIGCGRELTVVSVFVAVRAGSEFYLVKGVFARG
jgi:hypothetical protein